MGKAITGIALIAMSMVSPSVDSAIFLSAGAILAAFGFDEKNK